VSSTTIETHSFVEQTAAGPRITKNLQTYFFHLKVVKYYDTIEDRRVVPTVEPGYLRELLPQEAPQDGEAWADIQKDIETKVLPGITHWYDRLTTRELHEVG
jgi:hypothetical protein